jgi:Cd2+/Zn2+-exporting ATPase
MTHAGRQRKVVSVTVLVAISFLLLKTTGYHPVTIAIMLLSTALAGFPIFLKAIAAARYRIVGIDALVTIAVIGAVIIGEYWEAAAVTFLFMIGDYLESRTLEKTRSSIKNLMDLAPDTARVRTSAGEQIVAPQQLKVGDHIIIKPGERIAADGKVIEGAAYIDQSAITGEPLPVSMEAGDSVYSGTMLTSGYLIVETSRVGDDTSFSRILELVEEAQDAKAPSQKFIEKFSRYYTPAVVVMSALLYLFTRDIHAALTLLVIACPGALVISVPVSFVAAIGAGAKIGILFKGGDVMERLGTIDAAAFDKTGTLTEGKPAVVDIQAFATEEYQLLRIVKAGEAYSEHPLAASILQEIDTRGVEESLSPEAPEYIQGRGVSFRFEKNTYHIGSRELLEEHGISLSSVEHDIKEQQMQGRTVVFVASEDRVIGRISIEDKPHAHARSVLAQLKNIGIRTHVMLTGDSKVTAEAVASRLGIDEVYSQLLPEQKVDAVRELKLAHKGVAVIGDGINDAPALAASDVGIAIGGAGNDVAMETADVVLLGSSIERLADAVSISRAAVRNMRQNVFFAVSVAGVLLAGVLLGGVTLSLGMLVHELSVLLVIINAARLLGFSKRG